jgi:hypothetical protein
MIKRLLGALAALLAISLLSVYTHHRAFEYGKEQGIDNYHDLCYNVGGYVVDQNDGTVVMCQPMTQLPEAELKNFLDKGTKV